MLEGKHNYSFATARKQYVATMLEIEEPSVATRICSNIVCLPDWK